jgi:hypothetical protein
MLLPLRSMAWQEMIIDVNQRVYSMHRGEPDRDTRSEDAVAGLLDLLDRADAETRASRAETRASRAETRAIRAETIGLRAALVERDAEIRRLRSLLDGWAMWPVRVLWRVARRVVFLIRRNR